MFVIKDKMFVTYKKMYMYPFQDIADLDMLFTLEAFFQKKRNNNNKQMNKKTIINQNFILKLFVHLFSIINYGNLEQFQF